MHYTDDDLVLYYYGEARWRARIERHLQQCPRCAKAFAALSVSLDALETPPVPERSEHYGLEVWQRIRPELPVQEPARWIRAWTRGFAAVVAVLMVAAFVGGRYFRAVPSNSSSLSSPSNRSNPPNLSSSADSASKRARLDAIVDHLDRSERVLLDLTNASGGPVQIGDEQAGASDLVAANRLYRDSAAQAGDQDVAAVLDDLERSLLDVVHEPSTMTRDELTRLVARLDAAALLFKVRVLADELRDREAPMPPPTARKTT